MRLSLVLAVSVLCGVCVLADTTMDEIPMIRVNMTGTDTNPRCLDGSFAQFYIRKSSTQSTHWVVYFQGGGWCYNEQDCLSRSKGIIGTSTMNPPTRLGSQLGGILSPLASDNPSFHDANAVWVPYCDGGSYSGTKTTPTMVDNTPLWFRGRGIMTQLVKTLTASYGLGDASLVVMDGGSAGGLTVLLHADYFHSLLPSTLFQFGAIGDAGFFRPTPAVDHKNYTGSMTYMYHMMEARVNDACEAALGADKHNCIFAPITFPYLTSNMFIMEAARDSWQLRNILGISPSCADYFHSTAPCTAAENASMAAFGQTMRSAIKTAVASTPHHRATAGAYVSPCIEHVSSAFNENHVMWNWLMIGPEKTKPWQTVAAWLGMMGGVAPQVLISETTFPNNPQCTMYT